MPDVTTIVVCMTDAERPYLAEALRSVQQQTVPTKIILCVEETNDWVNGILSQLLPGIDLLRLPMAFLGSVRNSAVAVVETNFVAFLDGDDVWEPSKLRRQLNAFRTGKFEVLGTKHLLIREDGAPFFYGFARRIPMPSSWMGKTETFHKLPFENVQIAEDAIMWSILEPDRRCAILDEYLIRYRIRASSLSSGTPSKRRKGSYEQRSHALGARPLLLGASRLANTALTLRQHITGDYGLHVRPGNAVEDHQSADATS